MPSEDELLRNDARENRERLLSVARDALAADSQASLHSIAKAASVGQGTLYRHFPNREALLIAVYRKEIEAQVALAPKLLAKHAPAQALRMWCERFVQFSEVKYGVADTLSAVTSAEDRAQIFDRLSSALRRLLDACEKSGAVRPGHNAADLLTLLGALLRIKPTAEGKAQTKRLLMFILRGLA